MTSPRIARDPKIMLGKPCIAGTRIPVEVILEDLADGMSAAQVVGAYDALTEEDVRAALEYAS